MAFPLNMLQWGRNMIVAEGVEARYLQALRLALQWGRNMIVAEGQTHGEPEIVERASMGPQHDSCGREAMLVRRVPQVRASMGPQHDSCGRCQMLVERGRQRQLQWGRNMIVAEGCSPWLGVAARPGFNGAAT